MSTDTQSLQEQTSLTVTTDLDKLTEVVQWFEQFNGSLISHRLWLEAQIALVEGFTNAVRHAHKHLPAHTPIQIEIQCSPEMLQICIWDQGEAFDFDSNLQKY